jgi:hypothetical protein
VNSEEVKSETREEAEVAEEQQKSRKGIGGPKTPAGKARVSRNAVKHGILAETPVLMRVESQEKWEALKRDVFEFFDLQGPMLESLGTRAAGLIWRLDRASRFETEATAQYIEEVPEDWYRSMKLEGRRVSVLRDGPAGPPFAAAQDRPQDERDITKADVEEMYRMMMARLLPGDEVMGKVMRYETKVHRFLMQTLYQIMILKGLKRQMTSRFFGVAELNPPGISKNSPPGFQGDGGE